MLSGREAGNPGSLSATLSPTLTFWSLLRKKHFWAQKCILGAKVLFLRKNAFLRPHAADVYKTNGILTKMEPFLAQERFWPKSEFWAQNRFLGPESEKLLQNGFLGPKVLFSQK